MKIRTKLSILMAIVLAFPFFCISEINLTKRIRNTQKTFIQDFEKLPITQELLDSNKASGLRFFNPTDNPNPKNIFLHYKKNFDEARPTLEESEKRKLQWEYISTKLHHLPYDSEACLIDHNKVLVSTISELPVNTITSEQSLWKILNETSDTYLYQFETPIHIEDNDNILLIIRTSKQVKFKYLTIMNITFLTVGIFITLCIILIYSISTTIFKNLLNLEQQTVKIAEGDFGTPIKLEFNEKNNELSSLADNLERMRQYLEENKKRKSLYIMGISHDLRTPLAVIRGYIEAIKDGIISEEKDIENAKQIIDSKISHLENMVNELINFEKLDSPEVYKDFKETNLLEYSQAIAKSLEVNSAVFKRKIDGKIDVSPDLKIVLNPLLCTRLLENLFNNAVRYTSDGGSIYYLLQERENDILFSLKDNGKGMKEEDLNKIFDIFYRASNSRTEPGMGIGLAVVKNIIELHKWTIEVKSELEKGSEFIITIPKNKKN